MLWFRRYQSNPASSPLELRSEAETLSLEHFVPRGQDALIFPFGSSPGSKPFFWSSSSWCSAPSNVSQGSSEQHAHGLPASCKAAFALRGLLLSGSVRAWRRRAPVSKAETWSAQVLAEEARPEEVSQALDDVELSNVGPHAPRHDLRFVLEGQQGRRASFF